MEILEAKTDAHFDAVRRLLAAYIAEHGFSPNTSSIFRDLGDLPGRYAPPDGALFLAVLGEEPIGCVALAASADGTAELKRLFVSPPRRGAGVGRALCQAVIAHARETGRPRLVLSARASWTPAVSLFTSLGFIATEPFKPLKPVDMIFMGRSSPWT